MEHEMESINKEYVRKLESWFMLPFRLTGMRRFETRNSQVVEKSLVSVVRGLVVLVVWNVCLGYVVYDTTVTRKNYLLISEFLVLLQFFLCQNCISLNVMFLNRKSGLDIVRKCMNIDVLLGVAESRFMRRIPDTLYVLGCAMTATIISCILFGVVFSHEIFFSIVITESTFIALLYVVFDDYILMLPILVFLSMRIRYLNISLVKMVNLKRNYFSKHLMFDGVFWKDGHDDRVHFHKRANLKQYKVAFTLIFKLFRQIEESFRFSLFIGLIVCVTGLFTMVQWVTSYINSDVSNTRTGDVSNTRTGAVTGWVLVGWLFLYLIAIYVDVVCKQIEQTKLICIFIYLRHYLPAKDIELMGGILHTLSGQEYKISIFGMFKFNTDAMVKIFESIIVYVIMQLQLSLAPARSAAAEASNSTETPYKLNFIF